MVHIASYNNAYVLFSLYNNFPVLNIQGELVK